MASQRTRLLLNLGLLILVAVLVAVVFLRPGTEPSANNLTTLEAGDIDRIRVESGEQPAVELARRGEHWFLVEPWEIEASEARIEDLLEFASTRSFARYDAGGLDLARFELDPPRYRVWFDETLVELGKTNPVNRQRYARVGDTVHLIDDTRTYLLGATVPSYLGPRLLPREPAIARLELPGLTLNRDEAGNWQGEPERAAEELQALASAWGSATALWAKAAELPEGDRPRVTVTLADGTAIPFIVVGTDPDLVLARPDLGVAYTLPAEEASRLLPTRTP